MCDAVSRRVGTRNPGTIFGTVKDPSGGVLTGMSVIATNEDTNVSNETVTNERGGFEIPYLLPGTYRIVVQADGFKKFTSTGLLLTVNNRVGLDVTLEVGTINDEVTVTSQLPLLETTASASATLTNRQVNALPVFGNSALLLARSVPGMQWTGQPNYLGLHSNVGASAVGAAGGVGGTEYSLDGVPNAGPSRRVGYLPYTDTVSEIKVETAGFDASKGHTSGASISMLTKSGTNRFHGSGTWQYWNQDWNATQSTTNAAYYGRIEQAHGRRPHRGRRALRRRAEGSAGPATTTTPACSAARSGCRGSINGTNKLFFFFSYNGFKDVKVEEPTAVNRTVPTEAQRRGDFSDLLRIDPVRYQIYDPRTARLVNGRVVRDPFPNNQVPILNPLYQHYVNLYPLPNNPLGVVDSEGRNNYLASATPFNWDYNAYSNRFDWNISDRHRTFVRWSWNKFVEDRGDWTYETARGLHTNGLVRKNIAATVDHVFLQSGKTDLEPVGRLQPLRRRQPDEPDAAVAGALVGRAACVSRRARVDGALHAPAADRFRQLHRHGRQLRRLHQLQHRHRARRADQAHRIAQRQDGRRGARALSLEHPRRQYVEQLQFGNNWVRQRDDTNNAGGLGLEWAAFMLGVPNSVEHRYQRQLLPDQRVLYRLRPGRLAREQPADDQRRRCATSTRAGSSSATTAAWAAASPSARSCRSARRPRPPICATRFPAWPRSRSRAGTPISARTARRGSLNDGQHAWMPRVGVVFKFDEKTVARGGYGLFYDTNNVLNDGISQFGYSRGTGTVITNDLGLTFNGTNLTSPECRPTWPRAGRSSTTRSRSAPTAHASTSRSATRSACMARAGRGHDYVDRDWKRARQHRWRVGVQRELGRRMVAEVAYLGSRTDDMTLTSPAQLPAGGVLGRRQHAQRHRRRLPRWHRAQSVQHPRVRVPADDRSRVLYNDMANERLLHGSTTIRRHQLLRAFPHMNGLQNTRVPSRQVAATTTSRCRCSSACIGGIEYTVAYTRAWDERADFYLNEFDEQPTWRPSNSSNPHHFMTTVIAELPFGAGKPWLARARHAARACRRLAGGRDLPPAERPRDRLGESLLLRLELRRYRDRAQRRATARAGSTPTTSSAAAPGSRRPSIAACSRSDSTSCAATT